MNANDCVEIGDLHVEDHPIAQNAGVVDDHVERAPFGDGGIDEVLGAGLVRDIVAIGDGLPACGADLVDHFTGRSIRGAGAVQLRPHIVYHHSCALTGKLQRVSAAEATTSPRYDDDSTVTNTWHSGRHCTGRYCT